MAAEKSTEKITDDKRVVAATLSPEVYEALEDYRWQNRMSKAQVLTAALEKFFAKG